MKKFKIVYHLHPHDDVVIVIKADTEEDALVYAKQCRKDSFSIYEIKEGDE